MTVIRAILLLTVVAVSVNAGSKCPPRSEIHPCICTNSKLNGRRHVYTTVVCQGLKNTDQLRAILPFLKDLGIDKFLLYDSFWEAKQLGASGEDQRVLPTDWLTLTTIKEMEIVDSALSSCFACSWSSPCRNTDTTSLKVINSTSSDKICTVCDTGRGSRVPWMGCTSKLGTFQLSQGALKSVTTEFFPLSLREMTTLDLSYNQIAKIDSNVFRNVPNLKFLDLSHNVIDKLDHSFGQRTKLEFLDISYNGIKTIGSDLIPLLPKIKSINFAYNQITDFKENDWKRSPRSLYNIDLTGNLIRCDCSIRWINSTFPVHVVIPGKCGSPDEYRESRIRPTSRNMIERCSESGVLGQRKKKN